MFQEKIVNFLAFLHHTQTQWCARLQAFDAEARLCMDTWSRAEGGGGRSVVLESEGLIEKAAVHVSHVMGSALPASALVGRAELAGKPYQALGLSTIVHPRNPYVPTTHANIRLFVVGEQEPFTWWFGGGFDLTPYYGFREDCVLWHQAAKAACDPYGPDVYPKFKQWADDYFYLPHREEPRGIGGIFFDELQAWGFEPCLTFTGSVIQYFMDTYEVLVNRRKDEVYGGRERAFQCYRRGRYAEFNLLYDRGTLFGLRSGGRVESILSSLPPVVHWPYMPSHAPDSVEANFTRDFLKARSWL